MQLLRNRNVANLYHPNNQKGYDLARGATTITRRLSDCLEHIGIPIESGWQWTEERSPNHHKDAITSVYPICLIRTHEDAEITKDIMDNPEFRDYQLKIILAANASGGFEKKTLSDYVFQTTRKNEALRSFREAEEYLYKTFGEVKHFKQIGHSLVDYAVIEGLDKISKARILIETGEIPIEKHKPIRGLIPRKGQFGLVPKKAVQIYPYHT